jgi:hypothetical protein
MERGLLNIGSGVQWQKLVELGLTKSEAKKYLRSMGKDRIWLNDLYQAAVRSRTGPGFFDESHEVGVWFDDPKMVTFWISVKRHDKEPIFDWRHMQLLKNDILGEEAEAVQVFPAESRLMDTANQYHLFGWKSGVAFPIGFRNRLVTGEAYAEEVGAKQRTPEGPTPIERC